MRHPDGYTPPRRIIRPLWPRMVWWAIFAGAIWIIVVLLFLALKSVVSLFH